MYLVRKQSIALALLPALLLVFGLRAAEPAQAQVYQSDNPLAQYALTKVGTHGGQCKVFVQDVSQAVTGSRIGSGYRQAYLNAGAEISPSEARAGDILQISNPSNHERYYPGYHTAIVVENHGGGRYTVVDSNYGWNERVSVHEWTPKPRAGLKLYAYRINGSGSAPETVPPTPDLDTGQSARVDTGDGSRLNVRSGSGLNHGVVHQLDDGTEVKVVDEGGSAHGFTWVKVSSSKGEGWVASEYLSGIESSEPAAPAAPPVEDIADDEPSDDRTALVATDGSCLNLRSGPDLDDEIVTCMVDDTKVTVVSGETVEADGYTWVKVTTPSGDGWVADEYLAFQ